MTVLRIYADFNGLVGGHKTPGRLAVVLDTFGSLRDLANAGVILREGIPLIAVDASDESEDLEGHGVAQYDRVRNRWVVEFDEIGVRDVPAGDRSNVTEFRCVSCKRSLQEMITADCAIITTSMVDSVCPSCRTPILAPLAPPST